MDTVAYEKLLSELGIPSEWSAENKESVLDEKYSEALELLDVAQQNGEEDRITQLDDKIRRIEDALEYTKEMKKRLSSGLVLNTQSDKDRLEELKEMGKKEESANPLLRSQMRRAKLELEDENWRLAAQLYNDILNAEPENAEANLGLFMANQGIRERKYIPEAARDAMKDNRDILQDKQFLRTRRYADDSLKKELESYEKGRDYLLAIEELQRAKTSEDYQRASEMFDKLGGFADAQKQRKQAAYLLAECFMADARAGKDVSRFTDAKEIFEELGDYSDAGDKIEECEDGIKQLQEWQEAYEKYKQEYETFKKQVVDQQEIKQHLSKIAGQQARIDNLKRKRAARMFDIRNRWIFIIGGFGLLCYIIPAVIIWFTDEVSEIGAIYNYIADIGILSGTIEYIQALLKFSIFIAIFAFIISFVVGCFDYLAGIWCFIGLMIGIILGIPILTAIDIFVNTHGYRTQVRLIGTVALIIAVVMIALKLAGKVTTRIRSNSIAKKTIQLQRGIDDDYNNIEKIIDMEYQKIYDRYPDAGSERTAVSEVQRQLMRNIKKRNGHT